MTEKRVSRVVIENVTPEVDGGRFPIKRTVGRRSPRRSRRVRGRARPRGLRASPPGLDRRIVDGGADGTPRERPVPGLLPGRAPRPVSLHGARVRRSLRHVGPGPREALTGRTGARRGPSNRRRDRRGRGRTRRRSRCAVARAACRDPREGRRGRAGPRAVRGARGPGRAVSGPRRGGAPPARARRRRRAGAGAVRRLVRDVPAVGLPRARAPRHVRGLSKPRLPYVAAMGFDVLYLPPIHPIGRAYRKGKNNAAGGEADDPAAPGPSAARRAGTRRSIPSSARSRTSAARRARRGEHGIELALDLAFQCSPDHP